MTNAAIVIQNFNKADTLERLCKSLLECEDRSKIDVIFWGDSALGSRKEAEYLPKCAEVERLLNDFTPAYGGQFRSITLRRNTANLGCYQTCQIAIDSAFEAHDFVIFSEDDTIFSPDALHWFTTMAASPSFLDDRVWAIAGESIFFDSRRAVPDKRLVEAAKSHAINHHLWEQFISVDWIPSTCFATNRQKWRQFSSSRGETNGDLVLGKRCRAEGMKCLFPVVARVKDVGMLHPDGYSVSFHTQENVQSVKNCYLMSGDVLPDSDETPAFQPFEGNVGKLFWQSTLLNGFDAAPNGEAAKAVQAETSSVTLLESARKAGAEANWDLALELWLRVKEAGQATVEVETNLGLCLLKTGKREEARRVIDNVLAIRPDLALAQVVMAHVLEADKDFAGARDVWNNLRDRDGLPARTYVVAVEGDLRCQAAMAEAKS